MMGKQDKQLQMIVIDIGQLVPEDHLLKKVEKQIDFDFIYEKAAPYYANIGRSSIDPTLLMKMLLIVYLYGIKSERRLEQEVNMNIAYRYFCGLDFDKKAPDHSVFSQNRRRRFADSTIFREIFNGILIQLAEKGLITGKNVVSDGSFIPANVAWSNKYETTKEIERSSISYLNELDKELENMSGYRAPVPRKEEKRLVKNATDEECGYIHQGAKKGFGYTAQVTVDTENGIVIGVDVNPANVRESDIILRRLQKAESVTGVKIERVTLDGGYDIGAIHRGLEILGIRGYCASRKYQNNPMKSGFEYRADDDKFVCEKGKEMAFSKLVYKKCSANYFRQYKIKDKACKYCDGKIKCTKNKGYCVINASAFYPAFYQNNQRRKSEEWERLRRLRSIWSEGTFAVLKREHKMARAQKRGVARVTEECLFSALALNLKRMVKAVV